MPWKRAPHCRFDERPVGAHQKKHFKQLTRTQPGIQNFFSCLFCQQLEKICLSAVARDNLLILKLQKIAQVCQKLGWGGNGASCGYGPDRNGWAQPSSVMLCLLMESGERQAQLCEQRGSVGISCPFHCPLQGNIKTNEGNSCSFPKFIVCSQDKSLP